MSGRDRFTVFFIFVGIFALALTAIGMFTDVYVYKNSSLGKVKVSLWKLETCLLDKGKTCISEDLPTGCDTAQQQQRAMQALAVVGTIFCVAFLFASILEMRLKKNGGSISSYFLVLALVLVFVECAVELGVFYAQGCNGGLSYHDQKYTLNLSFFAFVIAFLFQLVAVCMFACSKCCKRSAYREILG